MIEEEITKPSHCMMIVRHITTNLYTTSMILYFSHIQDNHQNFNKASSKQLEGVKFKLKTQFNL